MHKNIFCECVEKGRKVCVHRVKKVVLRQILRQHSRIRHKQIRIMTYFQREGEGKVSRGKGAIRIIAKSHTTRRA